MQLDLTFKYQNQLLVIVIIVLLINDKIII